MKPQTEARYFAFLEQHMGRTMTDHERCAQREEWAADAIKANARGAVSREIKNGRMVRMPCETCGNPKTHAHHDDYREPLRVRFLCNSHHRLWHGGNNAILPVAAARRAME